MLSHLFCALTFLLEATRAHVVQRDATPTAVGSALPRYTEKPNQVILPVVLDSLVASVPPPSELYLKPMPAGRCRMIQFSGNEIMPLATPYRVVSLIEAESSLLLEALRSSWASVIHSG
jgi:hypothetical protein